MVLACTAGGNYGYADCFKGRIDVSNVPAEPLLPSPAPEILDYLARQPDAQDTIEGIIQWWVLDSCIRSWAPKIEKTVANLVEQRLLEEKPSPDGKIFYRISASYLATLQQQPTPSSTPTEIE